MLDLLKSVNDSMHQIAITGYEVKQRGRLPTQDELTAEAHARPPFSRRMQGDICELGRVLMQGSFSVWISHKKGPTRMKELARFKPMQRHLFLYERALLFCKRREEHAGGGDKTPSYSFKHCLKVGLCLRPRGLRRPVVQPALEMCYNTVLVHATGKHSVMFLMLIISKEEVGKIVITHHDECLYSRINGPNVPHRNDLTLIGVNMTF